MPNPVWVVNLSVYGPITVQRLVRLNEEKGRRLDDPFYSQIDIRSTPSGVNAELTARASSDDLARKAALTFLGRMLDILAFTIQQPLDISYTQDRPVQQSRPPVRRVVDEDEWHMAFFESRHLEKEDPVFLRALGWYRKGLVSESPLDAFLAFWNSIEIIAQNNHTFPVDENRRTREKVSNCFNQLWGESANWQVAKNGGTWLSDRYATRNIIAHGGKPVDVHFIEEVILGLPLMRQGAWTFLTHWKTQRIDAKIPPDMLRLFQVHP